MDEKFNALLSIVLVPQVIDLIIQDEKIDEETALNEFYNSKTYHALEKGETKMWHYSPKTIHLIYQYEKETGELAYPEEAA